MGKPVVAIVGRPNVGKSSFFNHVVGSRVSIVENTPGITRDRIYMDAEWRGVTFTLIDTGGIEPKTDDIILENMKAQAEIAIELADVIVFMVDFKDGVTANDLDIATMLRKSNKPIVVAVNKVDKIGETPLEVYEFYNLGLGELYPVSSAHGLGIGDLLDAIFEHFPEGIEIDDDDSTIKIALIGKPNAGKSSIINALLGEERVIVSDIPGTTRDAIDTHLEVNGQKYLLIDTAGIRRKSKITDSVERYSTIRSWNAVDRADICLLVVDSSEGITEQDAKIIGYAHNQGKASIIVMNKWDLVEKDNNTVNEFKNAVYNRLPFMMYAPITFVSAKTGKRLNNIFDIINRVYNKYTFRVATGLLNDVLNDALAIMQPPSDKGKLLKIYYMTQVSVKPPTFVVFLNDKELMHYSYERFLENQLRKVFDFEGTPIRFIYRVRD